LSTQLAIRVLQGTKLGIKSCRLLGAVCQELAGARELLLRITLLLLENLKICEDCEKEMMRL
jgi:hypothetical protein